MTRPAAPGVSSGGWRRRLAPPRRLLFTRSGAVFTAGILAVGLAAVNTGNNLLFLLLGALLGVVALSGILSEIVLRRVEVVRRLPRGTPVGVPARIRYEVTNLRSRLPILTLEIRESQVPGAAWVPNLAAGASTVVRNEPLFIRRGTVSLETLTLSTAFPFGLFRKERDIHLPGELVVWPSTERAVPPIRLGGERIRRSGGESGSAAAPRGDFRSLREYRGGDDLRDIHWKASARSGTLMAREYERDESASLWICLDAAAPTGEEAEAAVETAASLAARALGEGRRVGLRTQGRDIPPFRGEPQLERILDALARVDFSPELPGLAPPAGPDRALLVTVTGRGRGGFGQVVTASERPA